VALRGKKSTLEEVFPPSLCYTLSCQAQTRFASPAEERAELDGRKETDQQEAQAVSSQLLLMGAQSRKQGADSYVRRLTASRIPAKRGEVGSKYLSGQRVLLRGGNTLGNGSMTRSGEARREVA
jgi:hypothetical protein